MPVAPKADGRRLVNSLMPPKSQEKAATSQWSMGGLKAISSPLLTGRIQLPSCSIDMATTASRGSPRVLKGAAPRNQKREMMQRISNGM